jgi:AraC-like DNA-binding protein
VTRTRTCERIGRAQVRDRIDREYAQPPDVEALARGVNAGHLSRQFRRAYGESYGYLMTRRIERAMVVLRRGDLSVTDVCFAVGCSSLGFSTRFTELVGMPPNIYRRRTARATAGMPSWAAKQVTRPIRNREARGHGAVTSVSAMASIEFVTLDAADPRPPTRTGSRGRPHRPEPGGAQVHGELTQVGRSRL